MPHTNILDFSVFLAMSRRHMYLTQSLHGTRVLKENEIWDVAEQIWEQLPSCKIANTFVMQGKRICNKIVKCKGDNTFLSGLQGGIAVGIRKDFEDTATGNRRKDGNILTHKEGIGMEKEKQVRTKIITSNTIILAPAATRIDNQVEEGGEEEVNVPLGMVNMKLV